MNPEFRRKTGIVNYFWRNLKMHARPAVRQILIAKKMQKWVLLSKYSMRDHGGAQARARKNYQRLFYRYREIAEKIGLHEFSAF